jgi:Lrp/AsnC family leucine-responsive transcriptional regulator
MSPIDFAQVYSGTTDMSLRSLLEKCHSKKESFVIMPFMETLDRFDITILNELQNDGRLSNAELASRVGLSAAPCWRRVKALEEAGFITGYRAEINRHKMGLGVLAFVRLDADRNSGDVLQALEEAIRTIPEVISCHYISGNGTFELQVVSRDLNTFSQFAREVLINLPNVKDLHTSFSLGEVKASSALPLEHLAPRSATATGERP